MNRKPLVSICMPLYNTEAFLTEAVEGVLRQTYKHLELIICDNHSIDRSFEIAQRYAKKDKRVRLVRNRQNIGYAGNLHKVTSLARGDLMLVHCADDTAEPHALERMVDVVLRSDGRQENVIVISDAYIIDSRGRRLHVNTRSPKNFCNHQIAVSAYVASAEIDRMRGRDALSAAMADLKTVGWLGAIMYPRRLYTQVEGVYNGRLHNPDKHYMYKLLSQDPEVIWIHEPLFSWRFHESNQTALERAEGAIKKSLDDYIYTFEYPDKFLADLNVSRARMIEAFVDRSCLRKVLQEIKDGSPLLAFRYLSFALATYPRYALKNPKFYVGLLGCLTGPIGRALARLGYRAGIWRSGA